MKGSLLTIIVILIIGVIYIINKKRIDKAKDFTKGYDFIPLFQKEQYIDLKKDVKAHVIGEIQNYGEHGYRIKTLFTKEELESLLKETYHLQDDDFTIVKPAGLYIPS